VGGHVRRLREEHGLEAELVLAHELPDREYDIAFATWWETVDVLWKLRVRRRALFLQSFEQRFYGVDAPFERLGAEAVLSLPLDFVAVAPWLRSTLLELRPDARCHVVAPGVDKEVFSFEREVRRDGPLRVLVEGQPSLPFKGVQDALAAVGAMREPVHVTVVALDPGDAGDLGADRVVGGLDAPGMAELYRDSDVLLKLSRVEGLGLAPIEGFHGGLPCVITPYTGHEEYAVHLENSLVVEFDEPEGVAGELDELARNRELLARLSAGARRRAERWPDPSASTAALNKALVEIAAAEPAGPDVPLLLRTLALHSELGRGRLSRLEGVEQALAAAQAHFKELSDSRDECSEMLDAANAELERIRSGRLYRAASAAKRAGRRLTSGDS
jgi:glycosyltransferase involved in cell wall biosynthesis